MSEPVEVGQSIKWTSDLRIEKYSVDIARWVTAHTGVRNPSGDFIKETLKILPDEVLQIHGNVLTYAGLAYLVSIMTGVTTTTTSAALATAHAAIGVGDGNGAVPTASVFDSTLTAPTNHYYNPPDSGYPTVGAAGSTAGQMYFQSTFGGSVANFVWNEWALFGVTSTFSAGQSPVPISSTMINHKGAAAGTKSSGNIWVAQATITFS